MDKAFQGMLPAQPMDEYHAAPHYGSTVAKEGAKGMSYAKVAIDGQMEFSSATRSAFNVGILLHDLNLEQNTARLHKGPDVSTKAVKEWKAEVAAYPDKIVLTPDEYARVLAGFDAFASNPMASEIVSKAMIEHSFYAKDQTGVMLKCRPDGVVQDDIHGDTVFNYKSTGRPIVSRRDAERVVAAYSYDIGAAHEIAVYAAATGRTVSQYLWIFQETKAPYSVVIVRASTQMLANAATEWRKIINQISVAEKTGEWPGPILEVIDVDLPAWAVRTEDDAFGDVG